MTRATIRPDLLLRIAGSLLNANSPISAQELAEDLIEEDLRAGRLTMEEALDPATGGVATRPEPSGSWPSCRTVV